MVCAENMPSTGAILSAAASLVASAVLVRSIADQLIPGQLAAYFSTTFRSLSRRCFSSQLTIVIEEFHGLHPNQVFYAADTYLGTRLSPLTRRIKLSKIEKEKKLSLTMDKDEEIVDVFDNVQLTWRLISTQLESNGGGHGHGSGAPPRCEVRSFELSFHKKHRDKVLGVYVPYILERSKAVKEERRSIKLHTNQYHGWDERAMVLDHPMTFKTLGMDEQLKKALVEDLHNFLDGKDYYRSIGKAWKRGYLLYGPPGTGKSSLVAAMANYLNFDIYDLDLSGVQTNMDLRYLLFGMPSRSILVIEDIDCSIKLQNRESDETGDHIENKVTLSGLLNFIDGLWSSCAEARIIVFTTNHQDRIDPALLRPGRMDMHIEMSYCTFSAFKQLATNYLGLSHHQLFDSIEGLLKEVDVTPAEVARELMKSTDSEVSIRGLVEFLHSKGLDRGTDKQQANGSPK